MRDVSEEHAISIFVAEQFEERGRPHYADTEAIGEGNEQETQRREQRKLLLHINGTTALTEYHMRTGAGNDIPNVQTES
jgi:hypothetical protein